MQSKGVRKLDEGKFLFEEEKLITGLNLAQIMKIGQ